MALSSTEILSEIYNNCDPQLPASKHFYLDCTDVRGGNAFTHDLCREMSEAQGFICQIFTGHIGGGKSSELKELARQISTKTPLMGRKRFFTIVVNMLDYLDEYNITLEFILLAVVAEMAVILKENEIGDLAQGGLPPFLEDIKNILMTPVKFQQVQTGPAELRFTFQNMRTDPTAREKITKEILGQEQRFRDAIKETFAKARLMVKKARPDEGGEPFHDFILILDGLDRIRRFKQYDEGGKSHYALFVENASSLTDLGAHVIYTAPLSLVRSEGNGLTNLYGRDPFVLPMIKTEERTKDHTRFQPGWDRLTELLGKRLPPGVAPVSVFTDEALAALLYYSGGHIRSLLRFVRETTIQTNGQLPITLPIAQKAIAKNVGVLSTALRTEDWDVLAEFEHRQTQEWDSNNDQKRRLLDQLYILEYVNGGQEDFLNKAAPWYAVNPIVRDLNTFKNALKRIEEADRAAKATVGNTDSAIG